MRFFLTLGTLAVVVPALGGMLVMTPADEKNVIEVNDFIDEQVAFTNYAETAEIVAFERMPRRNLLHSWKGLGVTLLKTVRFEREGTAEYFRRQVGFLAFQEGADGIWIPNAKDLPANWKEALKRGQKDRELLDYLASLRDKAAKSDDGLIRIEANRVTFFFGWMPAAWENLDCLRLETVAWAKRMEQLLGLPAKDLPVDYEPEIKPAGVDFRPFDSLPIEPQQENLKDVFSSVRLGDGLSFSANRQGFSITWSTTNGPTLKQWHFPGGTFDFRLYIPGKKAGGYLPYRFHCDLDQVWTQPMAPATGRSGFLFGTDARFKPYSIAYAAWCPRVNVHPNLRSYGPDYPNPRPSLSVNGNRQGKKELGGYHVTLSFSWLSFYGLWPAMKDGVQDVWYVGVDRTPESASPVVGRIVWPRGASRLNFKKFSSGISTGGITGIYKEELARTYDVWMLGFRERYFPFPQTDKPTYYRGERASDEMFMNRILQPILDLNENAWQAVWTDKEHKPTFAKLPERVQYDILKNLPRMIYMSPRVGLLRRDYLRDRYAGKEPPEPPPKKEPENAAPKAPDADFDEDAIQLDDKEF